MRVSSEAIISANLQTEATLGVNGSIRTNPTSRRSASSTTKVRMTDDGRPAPPAGGAYASQEVDPSKVSEKSRRSTSGCRA
jgi:hypothetical protein